MVEPGKNGVLTGEPWREPHFLDTNLAGVVAAQEQRRLEGSLAEMAQGGTETWSEGSHLRSGEAWAG